MIRLTAKRMPLAQAFTMFVLVVNLALAIGSAYVTLLVVFRREGVSDVVLLLLVTSYEVASSGRGTRTQEGCKLFGCAEEPTQVKEGGMVVREATTTRTTMTTAAAATATTRHQWQRLTKR